MNNFKLLILFGMLQACLHVSAGYAPALVQDSLKNLYPNIEAVGWTTDQGYYVASFQHDGYDTKVWFDIKGHWMMKQTDWQVMDEVPEAVYHNFTMGPYSTDNLLDVTYVAFPNREAQIIILIGEDNISVQYQLFYSPDGALNTARNVTNQSNILGASTFL